MAGGAQKTDSPARCTLRVGAVVLRTVAGVLLFSSALVVAIVVYLAYLPADSLRKAALPMLQRVLSHEDIQLGKLSLSLRPRGALVLENILLGPPDGYRLPLFAARRLALRWDASQLDEGKLIVEEVTLDRPVLRVEKRGGKLNWLAFLHGLGPSTPAETPAVEPGAPVETPKAAAPPALDVKLGRLAINGLAVYGDLGEQRLLLDGVDLRARGAFAGGDATGQLSVKLGTAGEARTRLALSAATPKRVLAHLGVVLSLQAKLERLTPPKGRLAVDLLVAPKELQTPYGIPPVAVALSLRADADQAKDHAAVSQLSVKLDGTELLKSRLWIKELSTRRALHLAIERLHLPLAQLARLAAPLLPGIKLGGSIDARKLELRGEVAQLSQRLPDVAAGEVILSKISARIGSAAAPKVDVRGLSGRFRFSARAKGSAPSLLASLPAAGVEGIPDASPPAVLLGQVKIRRVSAAGASVSDLQLAFSSGATFHKLAPRGVAARVLLGIGRARYPHPRLGPLSAGLSLRVDAAGDLATMNVAVPRLSLKIDDWLRLKLEASARSAGSAGFSAQLRLPKLDLPKVWRRVPATLRRGLPVKRLAGSVAITAKVSGRLPPPKTPPWALPIAIDSELRLREVGVQLRGEKGKRGVSASGVEGRVRIKGRVPRLAANAALKVKEAHIPDEGLSLRGLSAPLSLRLTKRGLEADIGLSIEALSQRTRGLTLSTRGLGVDYRLAAQLRLIDILRRRSARLGRTQLSLSAAVSALKVGLPGMHVSLSGVSQKMTVDYDPQRKTPTLLKVDGQLGRLIQRGALTLEQLRYSLKAKVRRGLLLKLPAAVFYPSAIAGEADLAVNLGQVRLPKGTLVRDPSNVSLRLRGGWPSRGPLEIGELSLRLPNFGARASLAGRVHLPRHMVLEPWKLLAAGLPEFRMTLEAGLSGPKTRRRKNARALVPGIRTAGEMGLKLAISRLDRESLDITGRLSGRAFSLWKHSRRVEGSHVKSQLISLENLSADLPLKQRLIVRLSPFSWKLPLPKRSIFTKGASLAAFSAMRPFLGKQPALTFDRLQVLDTLSQGDGKTARPISSHTLSVGPLVADLGIADSTLNLDRLYLRLFGGDIFGALHLQVPRGNPEAARLRFDARLTGVNFAHLDPAARARGEQATVSALLRLVTRWARRDVSGRIELTELSLKTLDSLLAFLDPHRLNPSIQRTRSQLSGVLARMANPQVRAVSVWLDHSKLNLDIDLGATWPLGALMRQMLSGILIRRVSIAPYLPKKRTEKDKDRGKERNGGGIRRGRDVWRVR